MDKNKNNWLLVKNNLAKHGNKQNSAHEESENKKQKQGLGAKRWEEDQ